jgi:Ca-activated chloride channel homolog
VGLRVNPLRRYASVSAALLLAARLVPTAASDLPQTFKSDVNLVSLDICVRDPSGGFIPDLAAADFLVLENGKPQRVLFVLPSDVVPLTVMLLIDRSASMRGQKLERALEAVPHLLKLLGPKDQLAILAFNQRTVRVHAFGDDPAGVPAALVSLKATGTTALNDALLLAANDLVRARRGGLPETREAIIVLSDGEDTVSRVGFEEVLPVLRRSGSLVYAISFRADARGEWLGASWPLLALARDTGGRALGVPRLAALPDVYREIDAEVRHCTESGTCRPTRVATDSGDPFPCA